MEDAAKAANDIAIVLRRLVSSEWVGDGGSAQDC